MAARKAEKKSSTQKLNTANAAMVAKPSAKGKRVEVSSQSPGKKSNLQKSKKEKPVSAEAETPPMVIAEPIQEPQQKPKSKKSKKAEESISVEVSSVESVSVELVEAVPEPAPVKTHTEPAAESAPIAETPASPKSKGRKSKKAVVEPAQTSADTAPIEPPAVPADVTPEPAPSQPAVAETASSTGQAPTESTNEQVSEAPLTEAAPPDAPAPVAAETPKRRKKYKPLPVRDHDFDVPVPPPAAPAAEGEIESVNAEVPEASQAEPPSETPGVNGATEIAAETETVVIDTQATASPAATETVNPEVQAGENSATPTDSESAKSTSDDEVELDEKAAPPDLNELQRTVEAILFAAEEPLAVREMARAAGTGSATMRKVLKQLKESLDRERKAWDLVEVAGGYRFLTRPEFFPAIERLKTQTSQRKLTQAALETLALIAYRQPLGRAEVESVRGVGAGPVLRLLLDKKLIKISGRGTGIGQPLLYGTTDFFLEHFGLKTIEELPKPGEFKA